MKSKMLLLTGVLATASLLSACQTEPLTTQEFVRQAETFAGQAGNFGKTIKSVGPQRQVKCECTPKIGPDKIPTPQPPRSKEEKDAIILAIQTLQLMLDAEVDNKAVEVSAAAAVATPVR